MGSDVAVCVVDAVTVICSISSACAGVVKSKNPPSNREVKGVYLIKFYLLLIFYINDFC